MENATDGVGLVAGLPYPSSPSELMLQRKRSVNVNHLHSYHTEIYVPSVLNVFQSDHADPSPSHLIAPNLEHTSSCLKRYSDPSIDQKLYPVSFAEKSTDSKLLDCSMSGVRSGERSIEFNILHIYHSDPSASQSMSAVRSAERSIESNVIHSCHSDPPASQSMSVRSPESSIELNKLEHSELLNIKTLTQVTSLNPSMSDVRPPERSIELNQLQSYHVNPSVFKLHPEGLSQGSIDSKFLESNHLVQNVNFDLSISDMRSAERSLVLVL